MRKKELPFKGRENDSDGRINNELADHAAQQEDWQLIELFEQLSPWVKRFNVEFFDGKLPPTALSIDYNRRNTLGTYRPGRDGLALQWRVNLNAYYQDAPQAFLLSVLLHELIHQWECCQPSWKPPKSKNGWKYHTASWREKAAELGISSRDNQKGVWQLPDPNGSFIVLLRLHDVDPAPLWQLETTANTVGDDDSTSTIRPWTCTYGCTRVYVAIKTELNARCNRCGEVFIPAIDSRKDS